MANLIEGFDTTNLSARNFLSGIYLPTGDSSLVNEYTNFTLVIKNRKNWDDDKPRAFLGFYHEGKFNYVSSLYPADGFPYDYTLDFGGIPYAMFQHNYRYLIYRLWPKK